MPVGEFTPLSGLEVVEISTGTAGAYCGRLLADLGAEVTRVRFPRRTHVTSPGDEDFERALDLRKRVINPDAVDLTTADAVITDVEPGENRDAERLLAGVSSLAVLTRVSQFGDGRPGTGLTVSAWTSASWSIGRPDREPLSLALDIPDHLAGVHAAGATILGLLGRDARPDLPAEELSVASADVLGYIVGMIVTNFVPYGRPWHRDGPRATQSGGSYPGAIFVCRDGAATVMCRQPREWDGFREAMGSPEWARAPRFSDPRVVARLHAAEADSHVVPWVAGHTVAEMVELGARHGFPVAPVRQVGECLDDPQFRHRGFFRPLGYNSGVRVPDRPYQVTEGPASGTSRPARPLPAAQRPLEGMRVLDLSWVWSGPMVTSALADLGAEVIKVEHPERPDAARVRGRGLRDGAPVEGPAVEGSPYFNQLGHNKRSIAVNLATEGGRDVVLALAGECDIVVENMRPGVLERRGLGFDALSAARPGIVLLSMSTMGQTGPAAQMMGYGVIMSGLAGLEALHGYGAETMGLFNLAISDPIAGSHALAVLLAAVLRQRRTGEGCWIDLSQTECTLSVLTGSLLEAQRHGAAGVPGNTHPRFHPHGHFRCAGDDAWVAVAVRDDAERRVLAEALGAQLGGPCTDLEADLARWAATVSPAEGARVLTGLGIAASPVHSYEELLGTGWFTRRGFAETVEHPWIGPQQFVGVPWHSRTFGPQITSAAPLLGQDTEQVLTDLLGLDPDRIRLLAQQGAVTLPDVSQPTAPSRA